MSTVVRQPARKPRSPVRKRNAIAPPLQQITALQRRHGRMLTRVLEVSQQRQHQGHLALSERLIWKLGAACITQPEGVLADRGLERRRHVQDAALE